MNYTDTEEGNELVQLGPKFMASIHHDGQIAYRQRDKAPRAFIVEHKRPRARRPMPSAPS